MSINRGEMDSYQIHIIHGFESATGGCEWRGLNLYEALKGICTVKLWSTGTPDPQLAKKYPITPINPRKLVFPKTGTFVFVGVYYYVGRWIYLTRPSRTILIYNTADPHFLHEKLRVLSMRGVRKVEVVYASEALRRSVNYPGTVEHSLIDVQRFAPAAQAKSSDDFIVGRMSRDVPNKHHEGDPLLYRTLASCGCTIRIMGGTCLADKLDSNPKVFLLPAGAEEAEIFLRGLDCFYYRTSDDLFETYGRVVAEAMACALPVVCHSRGGYAEIIENNRTGFLFDTDREAIKTIMALKKDPHLRQTVGNAARESIMNMYSTSRISKLIDYYLPHRAKASALPALTSPPSG